MTTVLWWCTLVLAIFGERLVPPARRGRGLSARALLPLLRGYQRVPVMRGKIRTLALMLFGLGLGVVLGWDDWMAVPAALGHLDDYLFGDDDAWRRRLGRARNAVRWLMELPAPPRPEVA